MTLYKMSASKFMAGFLSLLALSGCVKPGTHEAKEESATFFNDSVDGRSETSALVEGFSIPKEKLFTFKTCLKDRRTSEALAGYEFKVTGGSSEQTSKADELGCIKWSEKIAFNYLSQERYLPISRAIVGSGFATGTRALKIAINPWNLSGKGKDVVDLAVSQVPAEFLAKESEVAAALSADADATRKLYLASIPIENTPGEENGKLVRNFKLELEPSVVLRDMTGEIVKVKLTDAKMEVSVALIESITSAGQSQSHVVSESKAPVRAVLEGSRYRAVIPLEVKSGNASSEYQLAVRVTPIDGPKGLGGFEGLYDVGDLATITHSGPMSGELKASNADDGFDYGATTGSSGVTTQSPGGQQSGPNGTMQAGASNGGVVGVTRTGVFEFTMPEPNYSGLSSDEAANYRVVKYSVKSCVKDMSNGGRPAIGVEFEITKKNGQKIRKKTLEIDSMTAAKGCLVWEDEIGHYYYAPESWTLVPVTLKHKSGAETKMTYAIAPYERWNFITDVMTKPEFIKQVNERNKDQVRSRLLADGIEFNTMNFYDYEVDDFLSMQIVKHVEIRVPVRVYRPSNMLAGLNHVPEALRTGRYLLKSAFVAPVRGLDGQVRMLVVPMRGLNRIVEVLGGEVKTKLDFAIPTSTILNARTYFVFELYVLDEAKLPKNDPYLEKSPGFNPSAYIDTRSKVVTPTFISPIWLKGEKDASIVIAADKLKEGPSTDPIDAIVKRNSSPDLIKAVNPLALKSVDDLYAIARADREAYRKRMVEERKLGLFVERANAEYVPLYKEKEMLASDPRLANNNIVLRRGDSTRDLIGHLNILAKPAVTQNDLLQFIHKDMAMPDNLARGFCGYFMGRVPRAKLNADQMMRVEGGKGTWIELCLRMVQSEGFSKVFVVDRRTRAFEVVNQTQAGFGRDLDFQTGATIGFTQAKSVGWGFNAGWGSGGITGELSKIGLTLGKGAALSPFMKFITSAPGYLGIGVDVSRGFRQSNDTHAGFSVASGKVLHMEQKELRVTIKKYEDCAIVRVRPDFLARTSTLQVGWMDKFLGAGKGETLALRGVLICGGYVNTQPIAITERYYTIGAPIGEQNQLDPKDTTNLPWLVSIRGQRDFAYFMMLMSGDREVKKLDVLKPGMSSIERERVDLGDMPLGEMTAAYDRFLQGKISTVPGYHSREGTILKRR